MSAAQQQSLFSPPVRVEYEQHETLDERYRRWSEANPHVIAAFIRFSDEAKRRGAKKIGAKMLAERLRWEWLGRTEGDPFQVNNSFVSRLAREAITLRPDLAEMFEFRELRS